MKGQYLAVETVFVFGLGLMLAIGVITLFNQFKTNTLDTAQPKQADLIDSKIKTALYSLKETDTDKKSSEGSIQVDLPERLAGQSYSLAFDNKTLILDASGEEYETKIQGINGYTVEGNSDGGDVTVFKQGKQFSIRGR